MQRQEGTVRCKWWCSTQTRHRAPSLGAQLPVTVESHITLCPDSSARGLSREEDEKPCELLSIMKSQSWVPKQGNVRQLLCLDPSCQICEATTLEIRQLLQSEKSQISPALLGLPQSPACLEMPISSESFEWNQDFYSRYSTNSPVVPGNQTLTQLTEELTGSINADGAPLCWTDPLQVGQEFHLADMPMASETLVSPGLEEPVVLMNEEDTVHSNLNYIQQLQDHEALNSQVPFQTLTPQLTVTHPMAVSIVTDAPQPFLSPEVLRLLEIHVKKLMHFQRWGLPRRVEESLKQFMPNPPVYLRPEHNQPVSFILNTSSQDCVHRFEGISPETWYSYMDGQPIQTFWVSEWSSGDQGQRLSCKPIPSLVEKPLLTPDYELLHDLCLSPEGQVDGSQSNLQKKFTQLFCGLPSMHSESLGSTFLCTQGVSKNTLKPPYKEPHFLKVSPPIPLPEAAPPPSSTSPNESLDEPQRAQIGGVPFLTLSECKTLEWHLLQRQLQLQWGLSAVIARPPRVQSHTQYKHKPWNKAKPRETLKFFGPGKPFSAFTRELFFIPQHARKLLEFHLQKRLIHLRWGLPQRIQRSINMLLSSTDPQSLPCGGSRLPNVSISQPGKPEAYGSGDTFLPTAGKGTTPMPHLFAKAQEMLKSHFDTKCEQIREGKVPACVQSAWKGRIPGDLAAGTLFPNIPQGQPLELQAENNPDLHQEAVSWKPMDLDQEAQAFSGVFIEHCRRPQALSEETIKKLETTLRHKYLAFLSGLQALYCMAPTKATSPTVDQSVITTMPWSVKSPQKPLSQKSPLEALCLSGLEPCTQDDKETSANIAEEFQHGAQGHGRTEKVPPERQPLLNRPYSLDTEIMERVSFYLKRKALDIKLGISLKESVFQEPTATDLESESVQEPLRSPRESTLLQGPPTLCHVPVAPDPDKVCLKQPATAVQVVFQEQNQPSSRAVPHRSARQGSQVHRNMMEAQVHYVQMGTGGEMLNLGEPFSTESQSPGKSKSGYVPTVAGKRKIPGKPKVVGDLGEGDAGLGFSLVSLKTRQDGEQEKRLLHRQLQGSSLQAQTFHLEGACPHSPQESPELQFADPPPEVFMETDSEQDMEDSQSKESIVPEPARTAKAPQPMLSRASQGLPFPRSPTQRKPSQGQPGPGHVPPGHATPASPYTRPSRLPEAGLKNKMKLFFHSIKLKMKSKAHTEPSTVSTPGKVAKTSKENIDRGLPQAKSPTKKTKPEDFRGPKAQFSSSEKSVVGPCLTPSYILDSKFWPRPRRVGSVSVLGHSYHCPRHCPRLAYANQQRNPP
ncbi:fam205a1 protein isoform X1 [Mus musculus]|uniref:fam205a1 protein isoform X1 n=1 Tax=Mus musculus TaxID=10090 RepID=UPI0003D77300|nr:fam205a1 protein isoform X1 [Mus musculus]|eukprot:XP_006538115.1 PREDICTED: predicted gene 12429 isoform X2 [Mus musculus]